MHRYLNEYRKRQREEDSQALPSLRAGLSVPLATLEAGRLAALQRRLTYTPRNYGEPTAAPDPVHAYRLTEDSIVIPRGFGVKEFSYEDATELGAPLREQVAFRGDIQPHQEVPTERALQQLRQSPHCAILVLPCGFGKTVVALKVLFELGRRAMVVVHKDFLLAQWCERIAQFLPGAKVGVLQGPRFDADSDVLIAMLQSVASRRYDEESLAAFGTCVLDEAHHLAARCFSEVFFRVPCRYVLGLTATPVRKDGLTALLHCFMGSFCFKQDVRAEGSSVLVRRVPFAARYRREGELSRGEIQRLKTRLTTDGARNQLIATLTQQCLSESRRVLLLSDRVKHLQDLHEQLGRLVDATMAFYTGSTSAADRRKAETATVVLATTQMAAEGLDIPGLDTLVLCTPLSDVAQAVGRVLRPCPDKKDPLVWDLVDDGCVAFRRYADARTGYYARQGYRVEEPPFGNAPRET